MEISGLIRALARGGTSILLITSEVEEMISLGDRILVLRGGQIAGTVEGAEYQQCKRSCALALGEDRLNA